MQFIHRKLRWLNPLKNYNLDVLARWLDRSSNAGLVGIKHDLASRQSFFTSAAIASGHTDPDLVPGFYWIATTTAEIHEAPPAHNNAQGQVSSQEVSRGLPSLAPKLAELEPFSVHCQSYNFLVAGLVAWDQSPPVYEQARLAELPGVIRTRKRKQVVRREQHKVTGEKGAWAVYQ